MEWQFLVAVILAIPVILFPAAFVWYLNFSGIFQAIREARARKIVREKEAARVSKRKRPL